ncbi:hypothetical protein [Methylocella sp. CPCC 101449]|uniref:hypothetical protein n=1 Tax=Methylocella sp. CPCC 101449 TaxID=2987531 RepID=UPI00288C8364|nr:hypothetical protein [Methylocella sp. CPCC 101449]MDT2021264.1 hypothetical protein [Methylocella sp. CPCC 101449]
MPLGESHQRIVVLPREIDVFNASIARIVFSRANASPTEVVPAAALAGLADHIADLPDGFERLFGQRGVELSAEQKQRLSIVLATPFSTSQRVFDALLSLHVGAAILAITHSDIVTARMNSILRLAGATERA